MGDHLPFVVLADSYGCYSRRIRRNRPGKLGNDWMKAMFSDLLRDDVFRLETARLWLRWPRMADAQSIVRHAGDKQIAQLTASVPHPYSPEQAEKFIFACRAGNAAGTQVALALTRKNRPAEAIGMIGIHRTRPGQAFLGYWLAAPFQGQGLMSEAAAELVDMAFTASDLDEVTADALEDNAASRRVLEKAGFQLTGVSLGEHRGERKPIARFRLDRGMWMARSAAQMHAAPARMDTAA